MRKYFLFFLFACYPLLMVADNWDYIESSDDYYHGIGRGSTIEEADKSALSALISTISIMNVTSGFTQLDEETHINGSIEHRTRIENCVKTYVTGSLANCGRLLRGKEPNVEVLRYMKRSELARIYDARIEKAKNMVKTGDECLEKLMIDMALQDYYWAYSLLRSVQYPDEVKDDDGKILTTLLIHKIEEALRNIRIDIINREGERVNLSFRYDDKPVTSLRFTYNDGNRDNVDSSVKDGRGILDMASGYEDKQAFHIQIDYEQINEACGDADVESVLKVITKKTFEHANHIVENKGTSPTVKEKKGTDLGINLKPQKSQVIKDFDDYDDIMQKVVEAARTRSLSSVDRYFTLDGGLPRYRTLLKMGGARVVGTPKLEFFKGMENRVVVRGLQMSLTYNSRGRKKSFVEDVVFTFNADKKIENVTFGLGQVATNDILCKHPKWNNETKELLMEFLENYKTAYCMKDSVYIRQIFADDAVIIIGNVAQKAPSNGSNGFNREHAISLKGQEVIRYNRYTKEQYLTNLRKCFDRNEFINLHFTNNEIQPLEKFQDKELFGIQIGQEYTSSTYSDVGYLFLLTDLTDHKLPQIKVRTWQPHEVNMDSLYHAGDFYDF